MAALYAVAADPSRWLEMIDVLDHDLPDHLTAESLAQLAYGAERVADIGRGAEVDEPPRPDQDVGVLIVSRAGRLLDANVQAQGLLAPLGFSPSAGGARMTCLANFDVLDQARRRLADAPDAQVIVKLREEGGGGETFAYVLGVRMLPPRLTAGLTKAPGEPGDLAILLPAASRGADFWTGLRMSFGLTAAETRLATRLADGMTLKEAAADLGLSVNTLRNQLTSIFDKLSIRRQSELIHSLNQLAMLFGAAPRAPRGEAGQSQPAIFVTDQSALAGAPPVRRMTLEDGRVLAWRDYGDAHGRPVIVAHAGLGASLLPHGTHELCRALGLRLICPDRPGTGRSDRRISFSLAGVAADIAELVGRLELGPLRICTLTSGARFGLALAETLGAQVVGVLMLSPRLPPAAAGPPADSPMVRFRNRIARNLWVIDSLMAVMRLRLTRQLVERITRASATARGDAAYLQANPAVIDTLFEAMREAWALRSDGTSDELRCLALEADYDPGRITAPVEVWHGAEDTYAPPAAVAAYYGVPPERLRIVGGIGSYLVLRHWGEVLTSLAEGPRQGYSV